MSDVVYKNTAAIETAAWARLIEQFKSKENLRQFIAGLVEPLSTFEDTISDIRDNLDIDAAADSLLDRLGEWVGETRQGRVDDVFRVYVKLRLLLNRSRGRAQDVLGALLYVVTVLDGYAGTPPEITWREYQPAAFDVDYLGLALSTDDVAALTSIITDARAAGVNGRLIYSLTTDPLFRFTGTGVTDVDNGFGAGLFAGVSQS